MNPSCITLIIANLFSKKASQRETSNFHGITLIAGVIFIGLVIAATIIVVQGGLPVVKKIQSASTIEQMKTSFTDLDKIIREVSSEGRGSKRTIQLRIEEGQANINSSDNTLFWVSETDAHIISPRTSQRFGNLVIGSNLETKTSEAQFPFNTSISSFKLENSHIIVYIKKIGTLNNPANFNTNQLVLGIYQKDLREWLSIPGLVKISLDNNILSESGTGWTVLEQTGNHLPYGQVKAFINTSYASYNIIFTLESGTDWIGVEVAI